MSVGPGGERGGPGGERRQARADRSARRSDWRRARRPSRLGTDRCMDCRVQSPRALDAWPQAAPGARLDQALIISPYPSATATCHLGVQRPGAAGSTPGAGMHRVGEHRARGKRAAPAPNAPSWRWRGGSRRVGAGGVVGIGGVSADVPDNHRYLQSGGRGGQALAARPPWRDRSASGVAASRSHAKARAASASSWSPARSRRTSSTAHAST